MSTPGTPAHNSESPAPGPANRYAPTPVERQRLQLDRLLKDPAKPVHIPPPPKEKSVRAAREMMKNVQGSSAGAGSGEFHVYKASRRREYERLKLMEEEAKKEAETHEFERKRREAEELADGKTAKNRAKRQKKKERSKTKSQPGSEAMEEKGGPNSAPLKKRRLLNGKELVFKQPGQESDEESEADSDAGEEHKHTGMHVSGDVDQNVAAAVPVVESRIVIHEDD
ncbi:hypothetical protein SERLA73DRAFT_180171 [Serpula lacrymans var. lacrymans S7.3]|uniref:DUF1168-domain-containing protein n=2 Tax=Serpula lacrymans var. lacrymans TaxID=341189 RepID=F8PW31_SERL3|nr:uncharacterized protein SERLADRAFT_465652 [Serpula lacrymans var. lacrymans S7.9]EGN99890.1 hypothetical protein SERLA73DRAFT_180171 [Serpula lacrymans var. lacrymans S7.3]EGO25458.1 hypothetical protein SERLADRAFT_465652 [Serpula lacrymans var. lacrymans S7.9]